MVELQVVSREDLRVARKALEATSKNLDSLISFFKEKKNRCGGDIIASDKLRAMKRRIDKVLAELPEVPSGDIESKREVSLARGRGLENESLEMLLNMFESDMIHSEHDNETRVQRSCAGREMIRRGGAEVHIAIERQIADLEKPPIGFIGSDLLIAWKTLLREIR